MRILHITAYTDAFLPIWNATKENRLDYCTRHGYAFAAYPQSCFAGDRPPAWEKIRFMELNIGSSWDWIWWSDADCVIMNPEIKLESLIPDDKNAYLVIGQIPESLCTNNFLMRPSAYSRQLLQEVWNESQFTNHRYWEQAALNFVWSSNAWVRDITRLVPYEKFGKQGSEFIWHFGKEECAGVSVEKRAHFMAEALKSRTWDSSCLSIAR
jgi:hypothetical protein